ncbi:MAG: ABC transporter permease [Pseudolabrys sp.]
MTTGQRASISASNGESGLRIVAEMAAAVVAALIIGAVLILIAGANPVTGYSALFMGAFGSVNSVAEVLVKTTPLLLAGLGIALAFKAGYWNIGAEGQLLMGALGAVWVGLNVSGWPMVLALPVMVTVGFAAGAVWGLIPGILQARLGASEIITTIMLNYVAFLLVNFFVTGPMKEADGFMPQTDVISASAVLPRLLIPTRLNTGNFIAVAAAIIIYWLMMRSTFGFRIRVVGANPDAAKYAGISVGRTWIIISALAGGLAGLAGMVEVSGVHQRLLEHISGGYGYTAIMVALLGWLHPLGVVVASVLFAAMRVGADAMQRATGVPVSLVYVIQALVILFVLGRGAIRHFDWSRLGKRLIPGGAYGRSVE